MARAIVRQPASPSRAFAAAAIRAAILAAVLVISGCASGPSRFGVTYDSYPRGATLLCGGSVMGYTPTTLYYNTDDLRNLKYLDASSCSANWVSGTKKNYEAIPWQQFGKGVTVTMSRPDNPGLQQDMEFALKAQQAQSQQQYQQQALQQQALQQQKAPAANSSGPKVVNCTKLGDLSGRIHQFQNICPLGYLQNY
jgi:hypothetical protein